MKRYHLFVGANYYPRRGLSDYKNSFETLEDAMKAVPDPDEGRKDWVQIAATQPDGSLYVVKEAWLGDDSFKWRWV